MDSVRTLTTCDDSYFLEPTPNGWECTSRWTPTSKFLQGAGYLELLCIIFLLVYCLISPFSFFAAVLEIDRGRVSVNEKITALQACRTKSK